MSLLPLHYHGSKIQVQGHIKKIFCGGHTILKFEIITPRPEPICCMNSTHSYLKLIAIFNLFLDAQIVSNTSQSDGIPVYNS